MDAAVPDRVTGRRPRLPTAAELECVDAVYRLGTGTHAVSVAALARRLRETAAVASERVRALETLGFVTADPGGGVRLTADGDRVACRLLRRHRVLERVFTDLLALPWERVHEEADRLTPVIADDVVDALARLAGSPATCPHGNPIPSADGRIVEDTSVPLSTLHAGECAIVVRIDREDSQLLRYLAALGLLPDTKLAVEEVGVFGGPILVSVGAARYALGRNVASRIRVRTV